MSKYKDRWETLKESAKKKRVNKQAEVLPSSPSENSSNSNSTTVSYQQFGHNQNTSSPTPPTFSKQSQIVPSPLTTTVNAQPLQQSPSSPPGTKLPFALQKPQQRLGVGGILDDPSNSKNNNAQRHAPLTTTILHATATGPNKLNADRTNLSDSTDSIEELLPTQLAFLPPSSLVANSPLSTRRESAPAIQIFDNSSSNSITTSNPTSQSMYHNASSMTAS